MPGNIKNTALRIANTKVSINSEEDPQQEIFKHTPESERLYFSSKIYSRHTVFLRCPVQNSQNNKVSEDIVMLHKPFRAQTVSFWYPFWGNMLVKIPRSTGSMDGHRRPSLPNFLSSAVCYCHLQDAQTNALPLP